MDTNTIVTLHSSGSRKVLSLWKEWWRHTADFSRGGFKDLQNRHESRFVHLYIWHAGVLTRRPDTGSWIGLSEYCVSASCGNVKAKWLWVPLQTREMDSTWESNLYCSGGKFLTKGMSNFCKGLCLPLSAGVSPESASDFYSYVRPEASQCWGLHLIFIYLFLAAFLSSHI